MKHFGTLLLKEERAIFSSPIAYATVTVYLLLMGYTFTAILFLNRTGVSSSGSSSRRRCCSCSSCR